MTRPQQEAGNGAGQPALPSLSVVIVTWNEAPLIVDAVRAARAVGDEVIVAEGGSTDGTAETARAEGCEVVMAPKGRGPQLQAGASAARGEVLLFLHADARLAPAARAAILDALSDPEVVGGAFYVRFLPQSWFTGLLEPMNSLRRQATKRYYGDTGLFVRASVYRALGGHKPWPVMHDYEFSGRMEKAGRCVYIREPPIWASTRRFRRRELRTLFRWLAIQSLYRMGVSPYLLGRFYPDVRGDAERFIAQARERIGQNKAAPERVQAETPMLQRDDNSSGI
ncbi:MAG TPA: glycosyltransferase [Mesorhizobium sp.]|nr:glycosyltransferase [Mesorhizobium sp.]